MSPYDTPLSGGLRFAIEIVAWVAGPWAVAELADSAWAAIPAVVVLVGLPALFNTPGDKKQIPIATPGPVRITIEMVVVAAAVVGAWIVWPVWAGVVVTALAAGSLLSGIDRYRWLAVGAPPVLRHQ